MRVEMRIALQPPHYHPQARWCLRRQDIYSPKQEIRQSTFRLCIYFSVLSFYSVFSLIFIFIFIFRLSGVFLQDA
jgi:hypothetical protein